MSSCRSSPPVTQLSFFKFFMTALNQFCKRSTTYLKSKYVSQHSFVSLPNGKLVGPPVSEDDFLLSSENIFGKIKKLTVTYSHPAPKVVKEKEIVPETTTKNPAVVPKEPVYWGDLLQKINSENSKLSFHDFCLIKRYHRSAKIIQVSYFFTF